MKTTKYVRKPLYVDAVQVTADNFGEVAQWTRGTVVNVDGTQVERLDPPNQFIQLKISNPRSLRETKAHVGDWVCVGDRGGFKIYLEKAFRFTFEKAADEQEEHPQAAILRTPDPMSVPETGNVFENAQVADDPVQENTELAGPSEEIPDPMAHALEETNPET